MIKNYQNQFEVSEKIENLILKILGKNIILWEKVFFFLNKIMLPILFLVFLYRCDYLTVRKILILDGFLYNCFRV